MTSSLERKEDMALILCVEDEVQIREDIVEVLHGANHETVEAGDGRGGLDALIKHRPDLVLCDVTMPLMDGFQLLTEIRQNHPELAATPFIFLTALADRKNALAGMRVGADDYLTKPVDFDLLLATTESRLRQVRRMNDQAAIERQVDELKGDHEGLAEHAKQMASMARDLAIAREDAEASAHRAEAAAIRIKTLVDTVVDGIITFDSVGVIDSFNPAAATLFGYTEDEAIGKNISALMPELREHDKSLTTQIKNAEAIVGVTIEKVARRKDDSTFPVELSISEMKIDGPDLFTCVVRDITERKKVDETIRRLALSDSLTGLANRNLFHRRLNDSIQVARRHQQLLAVMFLDLDKFKSINDTFGHPIGDKLLKVVGERLSERCRAVDTVARLGGDEFAIILADVKDPEYVGIPAGRILRALADPIVVDGNELITSTSIGISLYPQDATDPEELIRRADLALYEAKATGRGRFRLYDHKLEAQAHAQRILDHDLRLALVRGEFQLHYQPQLDIRAGTVVGTEALIRWYHPERKLMSPAEFIPAAEVNGLIVPIGAWVIETACRQNKKWQEEGLPPVRIAVNISPRQFHSDDLIDTVRSALEESGLDPWWLELEITEGMVMDHADLVVGKLSQLRDLGVEMAIDDFGTGFSSLSYLKRFPVQRLKVDQSFVRDLTTDADDAAIAEAIIRMGHGLNLGVIAEGVETEEHVAWLLGQGCEQAQGYYFSRPLPPDDLARWMGERIAANRQIAN